MGEEQTGGAAEVQAAAVVPEQTRGKSWLKVCSIGCAVLLVIGLLGIGGCVYFAKAMLTKGAEWAQEQTEQAYPAAKAEGAVPEEYLALFDEMFALSQREGASTWTKYLVYGFFTAAVEDGELNEEEAANAKLIGDFLRENPSPSMWEANAFISEHSELQNTMRRVQEDAVRKQQQAVQEEQAAEE